MILSFEIQGRPFIMDLTQTSSFSFLSAVTRRRHDVFLSFRGEDTRHGITKLLHKALEDAGIPTFIDDEYLEKGGEIASELLKAIQMSRVAIIVFSRNYANSSWCLDELAKIIECKNEDGQMVLPIFFDVDPTDVLQQRNSFEEALHKHEERFRLENMEGSKVERWREALTEAASSPQAWEVQNIVNWHQSKFVKDIVKHVLARHQDAYMCASIHPQRREAALDYLNLLLSVISDDVLVIGIWGNDMTNIAKAVYNKNFQTFESSCFLSNVSTVAEKPDGLLTLQKQFLSDILMDDNIVIDNVKEGIDMIKNAVHGKRVLVVLDNVSKLDQLNTLVRQRCWFGAGSRIIITTTDPQLLNVLEVDEIYGAQGIQVIEDQLKQNLKIIDNLMDYIQDFHAQAQERRRHLLEDIEIEKQKNAAQALVIANMKKELQLCVPPELLGLPVDESIGDISGDSCV